MNEWINVLAFLPFLLILGWLAQRLDRAEKRLFELERKLHEASDAVFNANMHREVSKTLDRH